MARLDRWLAARGAVVVLLLASLSVGFGERPEQGGPPDGGQVSPGQLSDDDSQPADSDLAVDPTATPQPSDLQAQPEVPTLTGDILSIDYSPQPPAVSLATTDGVIVVHVQDADLLSGLGPGVTVTFVGGYPLPGRTDQFEAWSILD